MGVNAYKPVVKHLYKIHLRFHNTFKGINKWIDPLKHCRLTIIFSMEEMVLVNILLFKGELFINDIEFFKQKIIFCQNIIDNLFLLPFPIGTLRS